MGFWLQHSYIFADHFACVIIAFIQLDLLGQQYYNMRANKEADIKEVADFVLSQLESLTVPNLAESDFIEHLREYQVSLFK